MLTDDDISRLIKEWGGYKGKDYKFCHERAEKYRVQPEALRARIKEIKNGRYIITDDQACKKLILWLLKQKRATLGEISRITGLSKERVVQHIEKLKEEGYKVYYRKEARQYELSREPIEEFKPLDLSHLKTDKIRCGIVSDMHTGSIYQQYTILHTLYEIFDKENVDFIVNGGDLVAGIGVYSGQHPELFLHSADEQCEYFVKHYPKSKKGIKTYAIGGNHDASFVKAVGLDITKRIALERDDISVIGMYRGEFTVKGYKFQIRHPDGGGAYARSYKSQKLVENILQESIPKAESISDLPICYFVGHYHQFVMFKYMGAMVIGCPCLEAQSNYLARKGLSPDVGGLIVDFEFRNKKLSKVIPYFYDFSSQVKEGDY